MIESAARHGRNGRKMIQDHKCLKINEPQNQMWIKQNHREMNMEKMLEIKEKNFVWKKLWLAWEERKTKRF